MMKSHGEYTPLPEPSALYCLGSDLDVLSYSDSNFDCIIMMPF